jgi:hypothetical protein
MKMAPRAAASGPVWGRWSGDALCAPVLRDLAIRFSYGPAFSDTIGSGAHRFAAEERSHVSNRKRMR